MDIVPEGLTHFMLGTTLVARIRGIGLEAHKIENAVDERPPGLCQKNFMSVVLADTTESRFYYRFSKTCTMQGIHIEVQGTSTSLKQVDRQCTSEKRLTLHALGPGCDRSCCRSEPRREQAAPCT